MLTTSFANLQEQELDKKYLIVYKICNPIDFKKLLNFNKFRKKMKPILLIYYNDILN